MLTRFALVALVVASSVEAFWRLPCNKLIVERADPIVSPGRVAGHVHTISGASAFSLANTFESLQASDCTSCKVKQDMSAYWTPQLYFQWANGSFTDVNQVGGGLIYYLPRNHPTDKTKVTAFPDGFRMLAGNPFLRSYTDSLMAKAIGWNCLGRSGITRRPELPDADCPNGLRGEVMFPSCWNGVDVDSPDHFSHMAYPLGNEAGPCPSTHPVRLVTLFYEMMFSVHDFASVRSQALNPAQPFVLAMGDPTGYGYHGDFLGGWDRTVLQTAIDTCTSDSGVIEYCKVFDLYDDNHQCRKTPDVDEQVTGITLSALPGCNPVVKGPGNAVPCSASSTPATISNPVAYTGQAPPPGAAVGPGQPSVLTSYQSWTYQDCYADLVGGVRALPKQLSTKKQTVEACLDACSTAGYSMCGIQYHGECWGGNAFASGSGSTALGYGACGLTCTDNPLQYCGGYTPTAFEFYKRTGTTSSSKPATLPASTTTKATTTTTKTSTTTSTTSTTTLKSYSAKPATTTTVNWLPVTSSTTSSKPSTTTTKPASTTATSKTTTLAPTASPSSTKLLTSADWTYSACSSDNVNGARSLPYTLSNPAGTIAGCLAQCKSAGYAVCGISYGGECYAGAALSSASTVLAASRCAMTCNGDATKKSTCGGTDSVDVYLSKSLVPLTQPSTPNLATFGAWKYSNCYSDLVNNVRSLSVQLTNSNKTVEACLTACTKAGSKVCGLSYYGECWSSTTTIASSAKVLPAVSCSYPCRGNPREWCGGNAALSVYTFTSPVTTNPKVVAVATPSTTARSIGVARTTTTKSGALRAARTVPAKQKRGKLMFHEAL